MISKPIFAFSSGLYSLPIFGFMRPWVETWETKIETLQTRDFVGVWAMHLRCGETTAEVQVADHIDHMFD